MTTTELFQRVLPDLKVTDPDNLPADVALDIVAAMNAAIHDFYRVAPDVYKRTTLSQVVLAPRTVSLTLVHGSVELAGDPFTPDDYFKGVDVPGDKARNEVATTSSLRNAYKGPTGTVNATVYSDVLVFSHLALERVITPPLIVDYPDDPPLWPIEMSSSHRRRSLVGPQYINGNRPQAYSVDYVGMSTYNPVGWLMRLHPAPAEPLTLELEAHVRPLPLGIVALRHPTSLPIPDMLVEDYVLDMLRGRLSTTRLWSGDQTSKNAAKSQEQIARAGARSLPSILVPSINRHGTPHGH